MDADINTAAFSDIIDQLIGQLLQFLLHSRGVFRDKLGGGGGGIAISIVLINVT